MTVNRWWQLAACVAAMMAIAFGAEAIAIFALLHLIDRPLAFVILTGFAFFAWGGIFSLFPATIADVFGPRYASANYGVQYTAKGVAAIFAAWGAAHIVGIFGSFCLKPLVAHAMRRDRQPRIEDATPRSPTWLVTG
jgi:hypothetical protein